MTPSRTGFDPSSTSQLGTRPFSRHIQASSCQSFKNSVLFPAWEARSRVLSYCALVASSPDPDDPEAAIREAEVERNRAKVVEARLDPYASRFIPREPRTERLASIVKQEQDIDNIVRSRTWGVVSERCGGFPKDWETSFEEWQKSSKPPSSGWKS